LVEGNGAQYPFDPNAPVTEDITAKAKAFRQKPEEAQPEANTEATGCTFSTTLGHRLESLRCHHLFCQGFLDITQA